MHRPTPRPTLFPYTTLFRSETNDSNIEADPSNNQIKEESIHLSSGSEAIQYLAKELEMENNEDRKSTRLNSSHVSISYAVFCLKKKKQNKHNTAVKTPDTEK